MKSKRYVGLLLTVVGLLTAFAALSPVANAAKPDPGYEQFAGCPNPFKENSKSKTCVRSDIVGGHFNMGNKEVPIEKPITLTGGVENIFAPSPVLFNSEGGLTKAKQKVPGGVIGLTGLTWLLEFLGSEALTLYATAELAGTPVIAGTAFAALPLKVHLENAVLGSKCYIGSTTEPIKLNLTTGTTSPPAPNKPITGKEPKLVFEPEREIQEALGGIYVDNSFAAPGANGCVLTLFGFIPISINGLVNSASGLPAAAGTNEAVQNFNAQIVSSEFAYEKQH
ncbi:MAG: hypothetical protein ABW065_01155 [Solirubrobacterales bacterium]